MKFFIDTANVEDIKKANGSYLWSNNKPISDRKRR